MKTFIKILILFFYSKSFGQYDVDIRKNDSSYFDYRNARLIKKEKIGNCKFIPLHEYSVGMNFYFPKNSYKEEDTFRLSWYEQIVEETIKKKLVIKKKDLYYKDIAGKQFTITNVEDRKDNYFSKSFITLKQVDGDLVLEHELTIPLENLKESWTKKSYSGQSFVLPYAIYTPEIDGFKEKYLGTELYTKFPVKGKKFKKVKIIQVGAGSENKPIRVIVENELGEKEQIDICTCGTNATSTYADAYYFLKFFQFENPKNNYTGSDETWEIICQGKIKIGMNENDLKLSWGEPQKINETVVSGVIHKQYVYADQYVYIENEKIKSFQSSK